MHKLNRTSSIALNAFATTQGWRRHRPYGTLQPIISPPIPYHTVCTDFITGLPASKERFDAVPFITYKFRRRLGDIAGKVAWTSKKWALGVAALAFLQCADWGIPTVWISDRDPKFTKGFCKALFTAKRISLRSSAVALLAPPLLSAPPTYSIVANAEVSITKQKHGGWRECVYPGFFLFLYCLQLCTCSLLAATNEQHNYHVLIL